MTFDDYQEFAEKTAIYRQTIFERLNRLSYTTIALSGEVGEFANKLKKIIRHDFTLESQRDFLRAELGDILWYVAMIACELNVSLDGTAVQNLEKLAKRKEKGTLRGDGDNR